MPTHSKSESASAIQIQPSLACLSMRNLYLRRGGRELFGGLSVEMSGGDLIWLRAPNGRGKTTLLRIAAGLIQPDRGELLWDGQRFATRLDEPMQAISYLDDRLGLSRDLSVRQNLQHAAALGARASVDEILEQLNLIPMADRAVQHLSSGQKKRVALGRLVAEQARVWLLDEPANGLDTQNRELLAMLMERHVSTGGVCFYASHDALGFKGMTAQVLDLTAVDKSC